MHVRREEFPTVFWFVLFDWFLKGSDTLAEIDWEEDKVCEI